jgi:signal transduction histidine kinase/CheY-like chemotaxis protein
VVPLKADDDSAAAEDALASLVLTEQVRLTVEQLWRVPLPKFLVDGCMAWTAWNAGAGRRAWLWLLVMTIAQLARTAYFIYVDRKGLQSPRRLLAIHSYILLALGAWHAPLILLVFASPNVDSHYVLTTILVGNAAGAVSTAAGNLRSYVSWAVVFGGTLIFSWLVGGTLQDVVMAALLLLMFWLLTMYVRDQGKSLRKLVFLSESLRHERDRAQRAVEARTRFFAAASHDLRQPLTALSYNAATVRVLAQRSSDETLTQVGDGICRALAESRGLLDSLLEVSELDAGALEVVLVDADVQKMLCQVSATFLPLARERGLELIGPHADVIALAVRTDVTLLRRAVQNLVDNAIKFTQRGTVLLEAIEGSGADAGNIVIRVTDTGSGIPINAQEHVFEEFYQVGNPERDRSRGLGLGLSIVWRIVQLINARIRMHSVPGQGTSFELLMPRADGPAVELPVLARSADAPVPDNGQVLFVDDEAEIRTALCTLLTTLGWRVRTAAGEAEALRVLTMGFSPDVLLIDFRLGAGSSGLDALQAMRQHGCVVPAILITGDTEPKRIAAARAAGIPVIYKPVDDQQLVRMLREAVARPSAADR